VQEHVGEVLRLGAVERREHLRRLGDRGLPQGRGVEAGVEVEVIGERVGDGPPHVRLAVRNAGTLQHGHLAAGAEATDALVDQSALADAAVADDVEHQAAIVLGGEVERGSGDGQFVGATDEPDVATSALAPARGSRRREGQP
jgi:hypothetical protein